MKKIGTKNGLARLVVQIEAKTVNSSAVLQCGLVNAPIKSCLKPSWNQYNTLYLWEFVSGKGTIHVWYKYTTVLYLYWFFPFFPFFDFFSHFFVPIFFLNSFVIRSYLKNFFSWIPQDTPDFLFLLFMIQYINKDTDTIQEYCILSVIQSKFF
jgi:hypothetical protein